MLRAITTVKPDFTIFNLFAKVPELKAIQKGDKQGSRVKCMLFINTTFIHGCCLVLAVLSWQSCARSPVLSVLFCMPCSGFLDLAVPFWLSCLAVQFWLFGSGCLVLAVKF
jgi:hypothetical protein